MSTPRTDAVKWRSDMDCYGQSCDLVRADFAAKLEGELISTRALAIRLLSELEGFDCDDRGQDLKSEAQVYLYAIN